MDLVSLVGANSHTLLLASVYNGSTYNGSTYDGTQQTANPKPSGLLTNTGFDIALITTIACLVILVAVIIRIWKRPGRKYQVTS